MTGGTSRENTIIDQQAETPGHILYTIKGLSLFGLLFSLLSML